MIKQRWSRRSPSLLEYFDKELVLGWLWNKRLNWAASVMPFSPVEEDIDKRDLSAMITFQSPVLANRLLWSVVFWKTTFAISSARRHSEAFFAFCALTTIMKQGLFHSDSIDRRENGVSLSSSVLATIGLFFVEEVARIAQGGIRSNFVSQLGLVHGSSMRTLCPPWIDRPIPLHFNAQNRTDHNGKSTEKHFDLFDRFLSIQKNPHPLSDVRRHRSFFKWMNECKYGWSDQMTFETTSIWIWTIPWSLFCHNDECTCTTLIAIRYEEKPVPFVFWRQKFCLTRNSSLMNQTTVFR